MAFIIAGAYIFTSLDIQLIMAIFLTIFIAALSRSTGFSLLIALVVNAVYLYITVAAGGEGPGLMNDKILLNIPFIFIIALHSSYLAEKGEEENREKINLDKINILLTKKATGKSREMSALIDFTENIFDSLTFAFIIFDTGGRVKIFNEKAEQLTGINKKRAEEAPINSLSALGGIRDVIMDVKFKKNEVKGRKASGGVKKREFIIDAGIIKGKSGNETGIFCIINEEGGNER
ncbi:MAG TPA: hypothetical protein VKS21_13200 [Spirochaetota bacterium]|nr:hypothetical protein [Spirochaetota bacterium]